MGGEQLGYTPEEVLQQKGENKGNLSREMAGIVADAEKEARQPLEKKYNPVIRYLDEKLNKGRLGERIRRTNDITGDLMAERALANEITKRASMDKSVIDEATKYDKDEDGRIKNETIATDMAYAEKEAGRVSGYQSKEAAEAAEKVWEERVQPKVEGHARAYETQDVLAAQERLREEAKHDIEVAEIHNITVSEVEERREAQREKMIREAEEYQRSNPEDDPNILKDEIEAIKRGDRD